MKTLLKTILIFLAFVLAHLMLSQGIAATHHLPNCEASVINQAIQNAAPGDTIVVPAGNCTWTTPTRGTPAVLLNKAITLIGAGNTHLPTTGINQTVITDQTGATNRQELIVIDDVAGRVSGFIFTGMQKRRAAEPAIIANGEGWRVDHNKFHPNNSDPGRGVYANGKGVIDNNLFLDCKQGVSVFGTGDTSWTEPLSLGTDNAVYVETNTFDFTDPLDGALDAYGGARYVFRYNRVINTVAGHHGLDSGNYRSPHSFEYYNNTFETNDRLRRNSVWTVVNFRGGTGVVHNNTITGKFNSFNALVNYRTCCQAPVNGHNACGSWGRCNGSNPIDGNVEGHGYPCMDQVGRTTPEAGEVLQKLEAIYEWNNTLNGENANAHVHDPWGCTGPSMFDHIQEGRDFYNDRVKPGYTPFTYPHPLTLENNGQNLPEAPTGLRVFSLEDSLI